MSYPILGALFLNSSSDVSVFKADMMDHYRWYQFRVKHYDAALVLF